MQDKHQRLFVSVFIRVMNWTNVAALHHGMKYSSHSTSSSLISASFTICSARPSALQTISMEAICVVYGASATSVASSSCTACCCRPNTSVCPGYWCRVCSIRASTRWGKSCRDVSRQKKNTFLQPHHSHPRHYTEDDLGS